MFNGVPGVFVVLLPPSLHKEKNRFLTDIMIQVLLKKDQVEVSTADLSADYTDAVLLHRSVVEDLNRNIRVSSRNASSAVEKLAFLSTGMCLLMMDLLYIQICYESSCVVK